MVSNLKKIVKKEIKWVKHKVKSSWTWRCFFVIGTIIAIILGVQLAIIGSHTGLNAFTLGNVYDVGSTCSMAHYTDFDTWWDANQQKYRELGITKEQFLDFPFSDGFELGQPIIIPAKNLQVGDIIMFKQYELDVWRAIVHRIIEIVEKPQGTMYRTMGDANLEVDFHNTETRIGSTLLPKNWIIGKVNFIPRADFILQYFNPRYRCSIVLGEECRRLCNKALV